jgi:hypothetical protein
MKVKKSCWTGICVTGAAAGSPTAKIKNRGPHREVSTHKANKGD